MKTFAKILKIKAFIEYNWGRINYPSKKGYGKKTEKNNLPIVFNVLFAKKEKLYPAYV